MFATWGYCVSGPLCLERLEDLLGTARPRFGFAHKRIISLARMADVGFDAHADSMRWDGFFVLTEGP